MGDDRRSIDCRAWAFSKQRLQRTAEARTYDRITALCPSHRFVFLTGNVPESFSRGAADDPRRRPSRKRVGDSVIGSSLATPIGASRINGTHPLNWRPT